MKSGKAVTDRKAKEALKQLDDAYRRAAKRQHEGECEIDDNAIVSITDDGDGAYVQAWVWVSQSDLGIDEDEDEDDEEEPPLK